MEKIQLFVEECISTFHNFFNYGKTEKMLIYCRPAVEKFIFNKIYQVLYDMYNFKFMEYNAKFLRKIERVKRFSIDQIMENLEVNYRSKY